MVQGLLRVLRTPEQYWEDIGHWYASMEPAGQLWSSRCEQRDFRSAEWYYPLKPISLHLGLPRSLCPSSAMTGRTERLSNLVNYLSIIHLPDVHIMLCSK